MTRRLKASEHQHQSAFFSWWRVYSKTQGINEKLCFAIKNDSRHTEAGRIYRWKEGVQAGVFDVFLSIPSGGKHGLYIELKAGDKPMSKAQREFAEVVFRQGYETAVARSTEDAIAAVMAYLRLISRR